MERLQSVVANFLNDRPVMAIENQNITKVFELLKGEVGEAEEVLDNKEKLSQELPDILWFVATVANVMGINLYDALETKLQRNELKYPQSALQEGNYDEIMPQLKQEWKENGGDERFYQNIA